MFQKDTLIHFGICFVVALVFGWQISTTMGITIELTQAEHGNADFKTFRDRLLSRDTITDLFVGDLPGILLGTYVRSLLFK